MNTSVSNEQVIKSNIAGFIGYDLDGVIYKTGMRQHILSIPADCDLIISGRTFAEYDKTCADAAGSVPVYIRGCGKFGDRSAAGMFKATMINTLNVVKYYEDDEVQADIIKAACPKCEVILVETR